MATLAGGIAPAADHFAGKAWTKRINRRQSRAASASNSAALNRIGSAGLYSTLAETCQPYLAAVWENFSSGRSTITEDVLSGKLAGTAWTAARRWLGAKPRNPSTPPGSPERP